MTGRRTRSVRDISRASRSSQSPELQKNPDGSVDVYFGPKAPAGKESNWVPTKSSVEFPQVLFRHVYGPEKPLFDKTCCCRNRGSEGETDFKGGRPNRRAI